MNKQKNYNVLGYQGRRRKVIKASNSFWSFTPTNKRFSWIPLHRIQKQLYACSLIYSSVVGKFWAGHSIKYSRIHNEEPQSNPNHKRPFANSQQALVEVRMGCSHVFHWVLRKLGLDRSQLEQTDFLVCSPKPVLVGIPIQDFVEEKRPDTSQWNLSAQKISREIKAVTADIPNPPVIVSSHAKQGNSWQKSL